MVSLRRHRRARPLFIGLGGTGVIGRALVDLLDQRGMDYVSLSLSPDSQGEGGLANYCIDFDQATFSQTSKCLEAFEGYDVVGVIDIIGVKSEPANAVAAFVKRLDIPVATISSCLLYDHNGTNGVDERHPTLPLSSNQHHYIRTKLLQENFWRAQSCDWVLIRTHHILGRGSLLGCIPAHNRDSTLLEKLKDDASLALAHRGLVKVSYVHPADLAAVAVELLLQRIDLKRVVNIVHPSSVLARDYYAMVATEIGAVFQEPLDFEIDPADFWSATARDNIYISNHPIVRNFVFANDIKACIRAACSISPDEYAQLGAFMQRRITGDHATQSASFSPVQNAKPHTR